MSTANNLFISETWVCRRGGDDGNVATAGVVLRNGDLFLVGRTTLNVKLVDDTMGVRSDGDAVAYRVDSATGEWVWRRTLSAGEAGPVFIAAATGRAGEAFKNGGSEETVVLGGWSMPDVNKPMQLAAVKLDAISGEEEWRLHPAPEDVAESTDSSNLKGGSVQGVAVDVKGDVFLVGFLVGVRNPTEGSPDDADFLAMKLDGTTGRVIWELRDGTPGKDDVFFAAASDSKGNLIAAGYSAGSYSVDNGGGYDYVVVKFDPAGEVVWRRQSGGEKDEGYLSVTVDAADNAYLVGGEGLLDNDTVDTKKPIVHKLDGADGELLWGYDGGSGSDAIFRSVAVDESAGLVVCSGVANGQWADSHSHTGAEDFVLALIDRDTGEQFGRWQSGSSRSDVLTFISIGPDGSVYLGGYTRGTSSATEEREADMVGIKFAPLDRSLLAQPASEASPMGPSARLQDDVVMDLLDVTGTPPPLNSSSAGDIHTAGTGSSRSVEDWSLQDWAIPAAALIAALAIAIICCFFGFRRRPQGKDAKSKASNAVVTQESQPEPLSARAIPAVQTNTMAVISPKSPTLESDDLPRPEPVAKNSGIKEPVEDKTPPMTVISSVERNAPTASANATATPSSCESPLGKGDSSVADRPISGIGLLPSGILASELPEKASSNPPSVNRSTRKRLQGDGLVLRRSESLGSTAWSKSGSGVGWIRPEPDPRCSGPLPTPEQYHQQQKTNAEIHIPVRAYRPYAQIPDAEDTARGGGDTQHQGRDQAQEAAAGHGGKADSIARSRRNGERYSGSDALKEGGEVKVMDDDQCSEAHGSEKDTFNGIEGPQARRMSHVRIDLAAAAAVGPMPALLTPDINCVLVVGDDGDDSGEEIHAGGAISWGGARGLPRGVSDDYDGADARNDDRDAARRDGDHTNSAPDGSADDDRYEGDEHDYYDDHVNPRIRNLDEISLASTQMPELLSPPFPGMLPVPSNFSATGTDGQESSTTQNDISDSRLFDGSSPKYFSKLSSSGSPPFQERSPPMSATSTGSHAFRDKSPLLSATRTMASDGDRWSTVTVGLDAVGSAGAGIPENTTVVVRCKHPPSYNAASRSSEGVDLRETEPHENVSGGGGMGGLHR